MNRAYIRKGSICFVVENFPHFRKLHAELKRCFNVTTQVLEYKTVDSNRFDRKMRILMEGTNFLTFFFRIPFYLKHDVIVCFARKRHLSFLAFSRILKLFRVNIKLYLYGFYIQTWAFSAIKRYLMSLVFTENIAVLVISKSDQNILQSLAPKSDIRYYPFCLAPRNVDDVLFDEIDGDYVFSGGHTNRDYDTLLECAEKLPQVKFVIVWSQYTRVRNSIPSNVKVYKNLGERSFYNLLSKSKLVVISLLRKGHSAGQTVALASMQFGKTTIYCDFENVSQYFDDGITGIQFISGDATSLEEAIKQIIGDQDRLSKIGQLAQGKYYRYYTKDKLDNALLTHIDDFWKQA